MDYQIDARSPGTVRVGKDDREVAVFNKAAFFSFNLEATIDGRRYQLKLAAPWTGFRYQLRNGPQEMAGARRRSRMHAFDPEQPLQRYRQVEFDLDFDGRHYLLTPEDRHGLRLALLEGDERIGTLAMRTFEAQQGRPWQADLNAPDEWSVQMAAFVAFLAAEGRRLMGS